MYAVVIGDLRILLVTGFVVCTYLGRWSHLHKNDTLQSALRRFVNECILPQLQV